VCSDHETKHMSEQINNNQYTNYKLSPMHSTQLNVLAATPTILLPWYLLKGSRLK